MAQCVELAIRDAGVEKRKIRHFRDAVAAVAALDAELPSLIFLDVLLTGPDGFTFLNELASYPDTARIPVVIISTLNFQNQDLAAYNVVGVLDKQKMFPDDIKKYVERYGHE